ncbi:hypothetical protein FQN57_002010 [Myotisia sp. PD_48]|nr:hypothetical protein FQN57_002010 [Myotisia sp. PD_48]
MAAESTKPAVLIIGGLGFIGRHLALHIHNNNLASDLRIVDKLLPQLAWLAPEFTEAFAQDRFVQADASREQSFPRVFDRANGAQFDYVLNCGGESRASQAEDVYRLRSHALSVALGKESARRGVKAFIECSTATVYSEARGKPKKESDKLEPLFKLSKWKLTAEDDLRKIPGLNVCILRLPQVYGEYDTGFLTSGICLARTHKELGKPLLFPYEKKQAMNTVYIGDAVRALWTAAEWRASKGPAAVSSSSSSSPPSSSQDSPPEFPIIFNIVDHNNTLKGDFADALGKAFDIKCEFLGSLKTMAIKLKQDELLDEMNEESLEVWSEIIQKKAITRPGPISPFLEKDVFKNLDLCVDGALFEQTTGFKYLKETPDPDWIESIVKSYERMGWWP